MPLQQDLYRSTNHRSRRDSVYGTIARQPERLSCQDPEELDWLHPLQVRHREQQERAHRATEYFRPRYDGAFLFDWDQPTFDEGPGRTMRPQDHPSRRAHGTPPYTRSPPPRDTRFMYMSRRGPVSVQWPSVQPSRYPDDSPRDHHPRGRAPSPYPDPPSLSFAERLRLSTLTFGNGLAQYSRFGNGRAQESRPAPLFPFPVSDAQGAPRPRPSSHDRDDSAGPRRSRSRSQARSPHVAINRSRSRSRPRGGTIRPEPDSQNEWRINGTPWERRGANAGL